MAIIIAKRLSDKSRVVNLLSHKSFKRHIDIKPTEKTSIQAISNDPLDSFNPVNKFFSDLIFYSDTKISVFLLLTSSLAIGILVIYLCENFLNILTIPLLFFISAYLPIAYLQSKANKRAQEFSSDYPSMLLATASSVKSGLSPYAALERSVELLPDSSLVKKEVSGLINLLRQGCPREFAVSQFAKNIRQPDLSLFRSAFLLILEHGGRFAPTLERLAAVCRNRLILIQAAKVSTATMRMTANILLAMCPIIIGLIAIRTENFFELIHTNDTANLLSSLGASIIITSYIILLKMSAFKP